MRCEHVWLPMLSRKASVPFIFATVLLESLGIGIVIPILPDLIRRFSSDPDFVSKYLGYFMAAYALMQFIFSPILGRLADRFGRRPVLLSSIFGAAFTVATAYMADISDDTNRSANFGMIGAAFGIGFIIGTAIGGLISHWGPGAPFLAAAALNATNFLFGTFVLPESLALENRRPLVFTELNPFRSLIKVFTTPGILHAVWVFVLLSLAGNSHPSCTRISLPHLTTTLRQFGFRECPISSPDSFAQVR